MDKKINIELYRKLKEKNKEVDKLLIEYAFHNLYGGYTVEERELMSKNRHNPDFKLNYGS